MIFTRRASQRPLLGIAMVVTGVLLLAAAATYYGYVTFIADRGADKLTVLPRQDVSETLATPQSTDTPGSGLSAAQQLLYPGALLPARQWADPRGSLDLELPELSGFTPLDSRGRPSIVGVNGRGEHIAIPVLGLNADISEIELVDTGDASAYATPAFTVGHIPETPNPGSHGNGWYFGHLESPIAGEGSVFSRLPRVPEMLRNGDDVHIIISGGGRDYLYLVTQTDLVHQDDLTVYQSGEAHVTLVTCYPRLRYDQRLLVTGQLIGFRETAVA